MSYLLNRASGFTDDMVEGFVAAHDDLVRRVDGGVIRAAATPPGQVAVVIGGGSGHYPAFAGLVGAGLAHGAATGNVFASPSAQQVHSVARAAASDAGVLLSYGNYAGDVLNFDQAQDRLNAEGIPTRTVAVTDDISSAPPDQRHLRRGVAGDLPVFRAAAWAAEQGRPLTEVEALARRANDATRTLGVAFSGCTLPGASEPLFTVAPGRMAVGMGIHGEPGMAERPITSADELAELLVDRLLKETPDSDITHVAVILNGLGAVKSEELYILYKGVRARLANASLNIVRPEVGEFATSFEMAGVSLTLTWLDDELTQAWCAPATTPGYRRGPHAVETSRAREVADASAAPPVPAGSAASQAAAALLLAALEAVQVAIDQHVDELGRLDAVAGDGDHGIGMQRGAAAAAEVAREVVDAGAGAGTTLAAAAQAWADRAGGTSGALWGRGLHALAQCLSDQDASRAPAVVAGVRAARDAIVAAGGAEPGDKTMLDALDPFLDRLAIVVDGGATLPAAWREAAATATDAAAATGELTPRRGRARAHSHKSLGTPDPGAVSFALAATAVANTLDDDRKATP